MPQAFVSKHHTRTQCCLVTNTEFKVLSQSITLSFQTQVTKACKKGSTSDDSKPKNSSFFFFNSCLFRNVFINQRGCCRCSGRCSSWHSERSITYIKAVLLPLLSSCSFLKLHGNPTHRVNLKDQGSVFNTLFKCVV